jgi:hypothetical protein
VNLYGTLTPANAKRCGGIGAEWTLILHRSKERIMRRTRLSFVMVLACSYCAPADDQTAAATAGSEAVEAPDKVSKKTRDPENPAGALELSVTPITNEPGGVIAFRVALENTGDRDVVVNLGMMLANGRVQLPDAIRLVLTDSAGNSKELHHSDRKYAGIGGRVDDYAVPLRVGSSYSIKLRLDNYWCPATKEFQFDHLAGKYHVRAELIGRGSQNINRGTEDLRLLNFWRGELRSEDVELVIRPGG